jgi:hypothetical protein
MNYQARVEKYIALESRAEDVFASEELYEGATRAQIISVYLRTYSEDHAQAWVNTATNGWAPALTSAELPFYPLNPEATAYAQTLPQGLPALQKLMLIMERADVSSEEIASIGY